MTRKLNSANGTPGAWRRGLFRINVTFPDEIFTKIKTSALRNNQSVSAEICSRIEASLANDLPQIEYTFEEIWRKSHP